MNRVLRGKVNTSPVPLFENNNCFSRGFLHLHITASLILSFQILKMLKEIYVFFFFPSSFQTPRDNEKRTGEMSVRALVCSGVASFFSGKKKKKK